MAENGFYETNTRGLRMVGRSGRVLRDSVISCVTDHMHRSQPVTYPYLTSCPSQPLVLVLAYVRSFHVSPAL